MVLNIPTYKKQFNWTEFDYTQLNYPTIPFQPIQFSISVQFKYQSYVWSIDRNLSGTATLNQSGSGSDGNERVLLIPKSSSFTRDSPSDCFVSYPGYTSEESYPVRICIWCILQPQLTGPVQDMPLINLILSCVWRESFFNLNSF